MPERVLFTPNFAPRGEYEAAFARGVRVTLDNLYPLKMWPEVFRGREIFLRIDPGFGRGHHSHVRTAGVHSKFGVPLADADELVALTQSAGVRVTGLHAHTGSGIFDVANWTETGALLADLAARFPHVRVINLGGGIGVPEQLGHGEIDLGKLDRGVAALAKELSALRVLDGAGAVLGGQGGRAGGGRDPTEGQGRRPVRGHRDRHEFLDQARPVRRASRHPQSDAPRASR